MDTDLFTTHILNDSYLNKLYRARFFLYSLVCEINAN